MGRIFKFLGSTPVSFDIVPKQVEVPKPPIIKDYSKPKFVQTEDKFVSNKVQQKSNAFISITFYLSYIRLCCLGFHILTRLV